MTSKAPNPINSQGLVTSKANSLRDPFELGSPSLVARPGAGARASSFTSRTTRASSSTTKASAVTAKCFVDRTVAVTGWRTRSAYPLPSWTHWSHPPPSGKDQAGGFKAGFVVPAPRPYWLALSGAGFRLGRLFPRLDGWWLGFCVGFQDSVPRPTLWKKHQKTVFCWPSD